MVSELLNQHSTCVPYHRKTSSMARQYIVWYCHIYGPVTHSNKKYIPKTAKVQDEQFNSIEYSMD